MKVREGVRERALVLRTGCVRVRASGRKGEVRGMQQQILKTGQWKGQEGVRGNALVRRTLGSGGCCVADWTTVQVLQRIVLADEVVEYCDPRDSMSLGSLM